MNRRNFLGTLASSIVGALMIRSLGQTQLFLEEEKAAVMIDPQLTEVSMMYMPPYHYNCRCVLVAAEDLEPGDMVALTPDGRAKKARGDFIVGVAL